MFNVSHSKNISGKVKTLSRNIMHSLNRLTDCSCSSEMSLVAYFQTSQLWLHMVTAGIVFNVFNNKKTLKLF